MLRTLAIAIVSLAGCLDAPEPSVDEHQDDIICAPLCDGGYQPELQGAYSYGFGLFAGARSTGASCADVGGTYTPQWDCVVQFVAPDNPCGTYAVECLQQISGPPHCNWSNPYNFP